MPGRDEIWLAMHMRTIYRAHSSALPSRAAGFQSWIDPEMARRAGKTLECYSAQGNHGLEVGLYTLIESNDHSREYKLSPIEITLGISVLIARMVHGLNVRR